MADEIEIIGDNGDLYIVRPCDESGCVAVDRFIGRASEWRRRKDALMDAMEKMGLAAPEEDDDEPSETWHVPPDVLPLLVKALRTVGEAVADDVDD